jgi:tetratricopeptide (TPR) repeat protein
MALLTCAGLWGACTPPERHAGPPLRVEYAGCAQVFLPGPVCALGKKKQIRLWVGQPPEVPVEVRAGGRRLKSPAVAVQGGQQLTMEVPPGASAIEVRSRTPQGDASWTLKLAAYPPSSLEKEAFDLWTKKGKVSEARHLLATGIPALPPGERWRNLGLLARIALAQGDGEAAAKSCREAIAADRAAGALLAEDNDTTLLAWILIQQHQLPAARKVLSGLQLPAGSPAEAVYKRSYHRGLLAEQLGDARAALTDLTAAVDQAERVGLGSERWYAEQVLGRQLSALGRSREAAALFDRLHRTRPSLSPCEWADLLTNQAWSLLLAGEAGERLGDPVPLLEEARQAAESTPCPALEERRLNGLLNLTLAHLQSGRLPQAHASLKAARDLDRFTSPLDRLWSLELEARLDLDEGRPEAALQLYERLEELAARASSPESRWRAAYGRARCYRDMGRSSEALAAFGQAEALLDEQSLQVPMHEGRETFLAQRERATGLYLEVLLARGRNAEALEVARRARSRMLRQLARGDRLAHLPAIQRERWEGALAEYQQQRTALDADAAADWELPADQAARKREARAARYKEIERFLDQMFNALGGPGERAAGLQPPRSGEVVLAYHPLSHGWVGFAATGGAVAVHRFELPEGDLPDPAMAALVLAPFRAQIERAERVRVLPYGRLRGVDFHALPFRGDILLASRPVIYGLDLAVPTGDQPPGRRALVVADPLGNLPAAVREADVVTAALRGQSWTTDSLRGEKAEEGAVRRALGQVDLLHYAGHGTFSGFGGWESVLPLAGSTRLTLGDVLTLGRAPRWVVLSGCETGQSSADAPVEGLGLAQAFLLAGSRSVIAATRPVVDRAAEGLFAELYQHWGPAPDLAVLLQRAELAWRQRAPGAGWASFRLFEP